MPNMVAIIAGHKLLGLEEMLTEKGCNCRDRARNCMEDVHCTVPDPKPCLQVYSILRGN